MSLIIMCALQSNSQSLNELLNDKTKNFRDIEYAIHNNKNYLNNASEKERKMYERWKWFWNTRIDSTGDFEKYNYEMKNYFNKVYPSGIVDEKIKLKSAGSLSWTCVGPTSRPSGYNSTIGRGRIKCIWVDPDDYDHILIGANSGGLWETTNSGTNWNCLTNNTMTGGVFDIAVDPVCPDTIYIATGLRLQPRGPIGMSGNYSLGIFKTTNGGSSWTKLNLNTDEGEYLDGIVIDPVNRNIIYALSNIQVYKSLSYGSTWGSTYLSIDDDVELTDIIFRPGYNQTLYVSGKNGIYKTINGGTSWTDLSSNLDSLYSNSRISIATNPTDNDDLYAFYHDMDNFNYYSTPCKIEKSEDCGSSWTVIYSSSSSSTKLSGVHYTQTIKISPNGDIYAGGMNLYKSINDGNTFTTCMNSYIHVDFMDIEFPDPNDNDLIYVTNDGGVYMDTDGGGSWSRINGNLATNEFYDVAITEQSESYSNIMVGGTHDCGTYKRDYYGNWNFEEGGDGGNSLIDQSNASRYYYTVSYNFYRSDYAFRLAEFEFYGAPVCMDPNNPDILYVHKWQKGQSPPVQFLKSTNRGNSWTSIDQVWKHVRDIHICYSNSDYIYYTMWDNWQNGYSEVRKTTDGGANWDYIDYSDISVIRLIAPINCVYIHPFDPNQVWIVFGGFEEDDKVFYSVNGGDNWTNITGSNLPNIPIQCFEYDFLNETMFVGTDVGIYYREMDDNDWAYAGDLPRAIVSDIELNKISGNLVVSTYGRGIWKTNLGEGYCYNETPVNINSNTTWGSDNEVCSNVYINSGFTLTVTADIVMSFKSIIIVKSGGILEIDGGEIKNGNIVVEDGGEIIIENNGKILLNNSTVDVKVGGTVNFDYGNIETSL